MVLAADLTCHVTVVRNVSGTPMFFSFLPLHGMELAANEAVAIFGDIRESVNLGKHYGYGRKPQNELQRALGRNPQNRKFIEIESTPAVFLQDLTTDLVQVLILNNGTLGRAAPCSDSSTSLD